MDLEAILLKRLKEAEVKLKGVRQFRIEDIFDRAGYLYPWSFHITNYPREIPLVAFNPAALKISEEEVVIFPRLVFDCYMYSSSIGLTEKVSLRVLLEGSVKKPINTKIILWPKYSWDLNGCEDARVHKSNEEVLLLYTAYGFHKANKGDLVKKPYLAIAIFEKDWKITRRGLFRIVKDGQEFIPDSLKSCAIIDVRGHDMMLLARPEVKGIRCCWQARASLEDLTIDFNSLAPILIKEPFEEHVGWSTNTVKLSSNEYLVGWHAMVTTNLAYYNGLAIVSDEGELLALSDYLLAPRGIHEEYGDRSQVIYGTGLVRYKEFLIWTGGISDYSIGIFVTELDRALEKLRWIKG